MREEEEEDEEEERILIKDLQTTYIRTNLITQYKIQNTDI